MAQFYWIELENGSVHVVPGIWLRRLDPEQVRMGVAWPTGVRAEQRWSLVRNQYRPERDWEVIAVKQILASMDEYDDAEADVAAVQKAHSSWRSSDEEDEGDEGIEVAALTGSSSGDSADSGLGSSPHGNQFDLSERGSTVSKAPTAKLRLIVRLASDDRNEHSDVVANLAFKLPADTHDEIMSEVILEVMPKAEQEADNTQGDDHPPFFGTCKLAWARSVPRRCLEDPKLGSVLRDILGRAEGAEEKIDEDFLDPERLEYDEPPEKRPRADSRVKVTHDQSKGILEQVNLEITQSKSCNIFNFDLDDPEGSDEAFENGESFSSLEDENERLQRKTQQQELELIRLERRQLELEAPQQRQPSGCLS
ncbi:hypothetical protein QAD02_013128 [Eretmocerus hayati]|uniref:Uncharacterized protein n=1 Tax=Eretmocerus hayati TaxID=131215 RepID=A0ACC2P2Q0_9HYME|nr:hypothetical protein QAD02_013128 [Eretmocerus hayati]